MPEEKRTNEEIDAMLAKGKAFSTEHPYSMFGDDNKKRFNIVSKVLEKVKAGESYRMIENWINDRYCGDDDEDMEFNSLANDALCWAFKETDEEIY